MQNNKQVKKDDTAGQGAGCIMIFFVAVIHHCLTQKTVICGIMMAVIVFFGSIALGGKAYCELSDEGDATNMLGGAAVLAVIAGLLTVFA